MPSQEYVQVVLFGASMTWSMRAPYGQRYADCIEASLLQQLPSGTIVDVAACGAGGNTAREALPRIEQDVLAYNPDVVVVNLGGNDSGREEKSVFEHALAQLVGKLCSDTDAMIVLETIPVLDQEWHAFRDRDFAKGPGGLNGHLERFAHSVIRRDACEANLPLHDRFRIYHDALAMDPGLRERLIRRDGVHLTEAGNAYFGDTLAEIIVQQDLEGSHTGSASARDWLAKVRANTVFMQALAAAENVQTLRAMLLEDETPTRLLLQQARSMARRASTLATDPETGEESARAEALAAAFLALQRVLAPNNKLAETGSRAWARAQLQGRTDVPNGLVQLLDDGSAKSDG
ncbi:MAG: SGNH/GDSL hydrolase family protein [Lentisphaeria bacterium]|nr:SGNH/GDSL hydrolase family protein [Lentisphaeria bacterium]